MSGAPGGEEGVARTHGFVNAVVRTFLHSQLSVVLVALAVVVGLAALLVTPREEDPQIVVPLADVHVSFPGHSAEQVEQLVSTPLEKLLYEIDGVEHVYSMSRRDHAVITVRFFVGEDRERSLVKLYKRIDEHLDRVPPGVTGWVVKPVEIDDVPIVTLTLRGAEADVYALRRIGEELVHRLAAVRDVSRTYVVGGPPRVVQVYLDAERLAAHGLDPLRVKRTIAAGGVQHNAGRFERGDREQEVQAGATFGDAAELRELVVGVSAGRPVRLTDVARVEDGPAERGDYVRHGWGPAAGFDDHPGAPGTLVGTAARRGGDERDNEVSTAAVTVAVAKKKGANAVWVARDVLSAAERLRAEVVPDDVEVVISRNYGLTADDKVNELVEALAVAVLIVIALLTVAMGWREALVVAVAVPVVFGLTLAVNLALGYTINRVTLFALILSLGLLVDDPIVDVENISRHFMQRLRATKQIVLEAVAEIRPPLITATFAVIVSFLPMFFITGMMGPYMRPMALNVPVTMLMSMIVAFTITPWMAYHVLRRHPRFAGATDADAPESGAMDTTPRDEFEHDLEQLQKSATYRAFRPLMLPLLMSRRRARLFLLTMALLTAAAAGLGALRVIPLKMLPFDNKNELLLVLDLDEGTTLERSDAAVRAFERYLAHVPEVVGFTSYVGLASPMDFNGMVRHYYLRSGGNVAEIRVDLVGKRRRWQQSHGLGLRLRNELTAIAARHDARLKIVETPPGPPVIATLVAEVRGREDHGYDDLIAAARAVRARLEREPGVVDVDDTIEYPATRHVFTVDREKAALHGISAEDVAATVRTSLAGALVGTVQAEGERNPLRIKLRLPRAQRSSPADLSRLRVLGGAGLDSAATALVPLAEIGVWSEERVDQTIYHKDLERLVYVFAETAGRPPAECVVDVLADLRPASSLPHDPVAGPRPLASRTYLRNGGGDPWSVPEGIHVSFAGEGEWNITLDVFRDLGLAFGAALVGIYILLVAQTGSFVIPLVVMLAIPLTMLGIMPGFWLLNVVAGGQSGGYADPVFFTATAMIGMIALAGIVTRNSIILIDFFRLLSARGRKLQDAIVEACVVRLRPILLTAGTAMLSAAPIAIDPIFSGLAWALIFGLLASTAFTLFVIPLVYWLIYAPREP